jgi:hypothetical protein
VSPKSVGAIAVGTVVAAVVVAVVVGAVDVVVDAATATDDTGTTTGAIFILPS